MPGRGLMRTERWPCSFHRFQRRKQPIQVRPQSECLPSAHARARAPTMWLELGLLRLVLGLLGLQLLGAEGHRRAQPTRPPPPRAGPPSVVPARGTAGCRWPGSRRADLPSTRGLVLFRPSRVLGAVMQVFLASLLQHISFHSARTGHHVTAASALRQCLAVQRAVICSSQRPDATAPRNDATYHCGRLWRRPVRCVRRRPVPLFQWAASLQHVRRWAPAGVQRRWLRAARPSHLSAADAAGQEQPPDQR